MQAAERARGEAAGSGSSGSGARRPVALDGGEQVERRYGPHVTRPREKFLTVCIDLSVIYQYLFIF